MDQYQVDIFKQDNNSQQFAELCNALYEREVQVLAQFDQQNISLLQRHLRGLPHHIKRAAEKLLAHPSPLTIDIHNGTWQYKQAGKAPTSDAVSTAKWFDKWAKPGLPVAVYKQSLAIQSVELDSIDRIDTANQRLHINKHGWYKMSGQADTSSEHRYADSLLLKPTKVGFAAACCGHRWNGKGKISPRPLSLRELLLSTSINWKTFR